LYARFEITRRSYKVDAIAIKLRLCV